jgi:hypothetical protein
MNNNAHLSILTCPDPACQHQQRAMMPTTFCQLSYTCEACSMTHARKSGNCCVFCSYADKPFPSMQEEDMCDTQCSPDHSGEEASPING